MSSYLADGPRLSTDIEAAAEASGYKVRTVRVARKRIGLVKTKDGFGDGGKWGWKLPEKQVDSGDDDETDTAKQAGGGDYHEADTPEPQGGGRCQLSVTPGKHGDSHKANVNLPAR